MNPGPSPPAMKPKKPKAGVKAPEPIGCLLLLLLNLQAVRIF